MSESQGTIEAEAIAKRLATIDAHRLHSLLIRSTALRHQDLLRSWSAAVTTPREAELDLDLEAFLDWCAAGVELFLRGGLPSRRSIDDAAHRVMLAAVLRRHSSISAAAAALETSRRALRAAMKRLGLYEAWQQWRTRSTQAASAAKSSGKSGPSESTEPLEPSGTEIPSSEQGAPTV
ncbi:hypothetical protein [Paraliomyxa miuraensis]|uniref:hypothetical protein n=1 Tax=Paraliomyxa miuraensis TaxID=376150 RepID=UPI00224EF355|nr:hypothetical protein [Paraliomyxa miuraensis]MCX4245767.1 hypothetical protein [Paraliomyxa miuraensis]